MCRSSLLFLFVVLFPCVASADGPLTCPKEARTADEIFKAAEKENLFGGLRATASIHKAEFQDDRRRELVVWHNPYSGIAACHVYIYQFDKDKNLWIQRLAKVFRDTHKVSVEFDSETKIRDAMGKVVHRQAKDNRAE